MKRMGGPGDRPPSGPPSGDPQAERRRIMRSRNIALALVLAAFVLLFFAITIVKMKV